MATNANLPPGAFITSLGTRRCTAVPRSTTGGTQQGTLATSTSTSTTSTKAQQTATQALAPAAPQQDPPIAPVLSTTTSISEQTTTSTTSFIPTPQTTTAQTQAAAPALISPADATTPDNTPITQPSSTQIALTPSPTAQSIASATIVAESALQGQSINTDNSIAPTSLVGSQTTAALDTATAETPALITTIGTATGVSPGAIIATDTATSGGTSVSTSDNGGISTQTTVAVAGGVIGGLVALSLVGFLVWFWRKRSFKRRRSTMLTPLGPESGFGNTSEKVQYSVNRTSIGPTTISEKVRATVDSNVKKLRVRFGGLGRLSSASSVNLNRGNSQFMDGSIHSRENSSSEIGQDLRAVGTKDRVKKWWGGLSSRNKFNWPVMISWPKQHNDEFATQRGMKENNVPRVGSQPDFLTLLSMDDKQLAAQANKGRNSMNGVPRRSASTGSTSHFLGGLGLDFDSANPFSDANVMSHDSARVAPLTVSDANNPFSDSNAVRAPLASKQGTGPANYLENIRRSRGQSVSGTAATRPPSFNPRGRMDSVYRESGASVESFATRRNKFRSDPFDLDRPELLSSAGSIPSFDGFDSSSMAGRVGPTTPGRTHLRTESFTSKYSSGTSLAEWSDPGPDVGPASTRWDSPTPTGERNEGKKRKSGGSQATVGKAY